MSAIDDALRAMDRYVSARKPAKPRLNRGGKKRSAKPRVVSPPRRHIKPAAYNPPRSEPDVTELSESFAPAPTPTPPEVEGRISAPLYVPPAEVCHRCGGRGEDPEHAGTCSECGVLEPSPKPPDWVDGRATVRPQKPDIVEVRGGVRLPSSRPRAPRWRAPRRLEGTST